MTIYTIKNHLQHISTLLVNAIITLILVQNINGEWTVNLIHNKFVKKHKHVVFIDDVKQFSILKIRIGIEGKKVHKQVRDQRSIEANKDGAQMLLEKK